MKRLIDLGVSIGLLFVFMPVMTLVAFLIWADSGGPVFYTQSRWGLRRKPFTIYKFRTLKTGNPDPCERYETVETDPRITKVGGVLRKTSLDEFPQLFNVVLGDMSLVGPRPLVEWESVEADQDYGERYQVKPGVTGLTQVSGRNALSWAERLELDVVYVSRWSLWLDLMILLRTPFAVLQFDNVYPMPKHSRK
ncbi:putative sugar transferase EpsL [Pseudobythopirellula maris]|uniref:Putative sugar transferase EpsL n=2 Tax=Pseudobythopirellula maris TaxID=2527991 RepID=A0A5C5ZRE9_9BACT|nr:putative sugar transferase EpsL [Pseudobythopirellula maris]